MHSAASRGVLGLFAMPETFLDQVNQRSSNVESPPAQEEEYPRATEGSSHILDPFRVSSATLFSRPKRQVLWRGKKCIIALPVEDRRGCGDLILLTPEDVDARLQEWRMKGWNTQGCTVEENPVDFGSTNLSSQCRLPYPDPAELLTERLEGKYKVRIPKDEAACHTLDGRITDEEAFAPDVSNEFAEHPRTSTILRTAEGQAATAWLSVTQQASVHQVDLLSEKYSTDPVMDLQRHVQSGYDIPPLFDAVPRLVENCNMGGQGFLAPLGVELGSIETALYRIERPSTDLVTRVQQTAIETSPSLTGSPPLPAKMNGAQARIVEAHEAFKIASRSGALRDAAQSQELQPGVRTTTLEYIDIIPKDFSNDHGLGSSGTVPQLTRDIPRTAAQDLPKPLLLHELGTMARSSHEDLIFEAPDVQPSRDSNSSQRDLGITSHRAASRDAIASQPKSYSRNGVRRSPGVEGQPSFEMAKQRKSSGRTYLSCESSSSSLVKDYQLPMSVLASSTSSQGEHEVVEMRVQTSSLRSTSSGAADTCSPLRKVCSPTYLHVSNRATPGMDTSSKRAVEAQQAKVDGEPILRSSSKVAQQTVSIQVMQDQPPLLSIVPSHDQEGGPSYEDIDTVIRQLEQNPDLGVERTDTSRIQSGVLREPNLPSINHMYSNAPNSNVVKPSMAYESLQDGMNFRPQLRDPALGHGQMGYVHKLNHYDDDHISDWNEALSSSDEVKLLSVPRLLDADVNSTIDGILQKRLGPLLTTLEAIQRSVVTKTEKSECGRSLRDLSTDKLDSDADDEDDDEGMGTPPPHRLHPSMFRNGRRAENIKTAVLEALRSHQPLDSQPADPGRSILHEAIEEIKHLVEASSTESRRAEMKEVVEGVISTHPRLRGHRVQHGHDFGGNEEKHRLQLNGLESMLKIANERAQDELRLRRRTEDELADALRQLRYAEEEVAQLRESSEEIELTLRAYHEKKESVRGLERDMSEAALRNAALETTLEEYRLSSDQFRDDIHEEQARNKELRSMITKLKMQVEETLQSRQSLRGRLEHLQEDMAVAVKELAHEKALWRQNEQELMVESQLKQSALDHEIRQRENIELKLDDLDKKYQEVAVYKVNCAHAQQEVSRLEGLLDSLRQKNKEHEDACFQAERKLAYARESNQADAQCVRTTMKAEVDAAISQLGSLRADFERQIAQLQSQLQIARIEHNDAKAHFDRLLSETFVSHRRSLSEAAESKATALQGQQTLYERAMNELREGHARALHNSADDRHRVEQHMAERLAISNDKVQHLEDKVVDLEERYAITKSAARAAVEAATAKGRGSLTPAAPAVAYSPLSTAVTLQSAKGTDIPEKISPQALRESILVLQDQLQHREQTIENLQAELAGIDREAPAKVKEGQTEIGWLRELLEVRTDDLEDVISKLADASYDREAVREAAIRLQAGLQMELQERECVANGSGSAIPPSITTFTRPRRILSKAPGAAAWDNWRKARDVSLCALSDLAGLGSQTLSKTTGGAASASFMSMLTSSNSSQRQITPIQDDDAFALNLPEVSGRKTNFEARPLRTCNLQPRSLSSQRTDERHTKDWERQQQLRPGRSPTPPLMSKESYDGDAEARTVLDNMDGGSTSTAERESMTLAHSVVAEEED